MLSQVACITRNAYNNTVHKQATLYLNDTAEFRIKMIDGLGPVKTEIPTMDSPIDPGGSILSTRDGMRTISLTVGLYPDYGSGSTVSELRHELMGVFTPGNRVEMSFTVDGVVYFIEGVVEIHEPTIFDRDPAVTISLMCEDPYFTIPAEGIITFNMPTGLLPVIVVPYEGTAPTGFIFEFDVVATTTPITIRKMPLGVTKRIIISNSALAVADTVIINTNKGSRGVTRVRSGGSTSILGYMSGGLSDMNLVPGLNAFHSDQAGTWFNNAKFKYQKRYAGL